LFAEELEGIEQIGLGDLVVAPVQRLPQGAAETLAHLLRLPLQATEEGALVPIAEVVEEGLVGHRFDRTLEHQLGIAATQVGGETGHLHVIAAPPPCVHQVEDARLEGVVQGGGLIHQHIQGAVDAHPLRGPFQRVVATGLGAAAQQAEAQGQGPGIRLPNPHGDTSFYGIPRSLRRRRAKT